jgi:hypothetical protein
MMDDWRALLASADWVGGLAAGLLLLVVLGWLD